MKLVLADNWRYLFFIAVTLIATITAAFSCTSIHTSSMRPRQKVLCGWESESHRFDIVYAVVLMDRNGGIVLLSNPDHIEPHPSFRALFADSISGKLLDSLKRTGVEYDRRFPKDSVQMILGILDSLQNAPVELDSTPISAHGGEETWFCYSYNEESQTYYRIRLQFNGRFKSSVQNPIADHLIALITKYALGEYMSGRRMM